MDWQWAVTLLIGAVALGVQRWLTSRENQQLVNQTRDLTGRVVKVEADEMKCQEDRRIQDVKLLESMERERLLREVMPKRLVDGIETLINETQQQTQHLAGAAQSLKKIDTWDSDPVKSFKGDLQAVKDLAMEQGHSIKDIERAINQLMRIKEEPPSVRIEVEQVGDKKAPMTVEEK